MKESEFGCVHSHNLRCCFFPSEKKLTCHSNKKAQVQLAQLRMIKLPYFLFTVVVLLMLTHCATSMSLHLTPVLFLLCCESVT